MTTCCYTLLESNCIRAAHHREADSDVNFLDCEIVAQRATVRSLKGNFERLARGESHACTKGERIQHVRL